MAAILSTTFAQPATAQTATWTLASVTGVQKGHVCSVESELVQVLQVGPGLTLTVQRGIEGTATAAHATSTPVAIYRADDVQTGAVVPVSAAAVSLRQATLTLTDAQILDWKSTPQRVIGAPGVNKLLVPITITLVGHFVGTYTGDADGDLLDFYYAQGPFGVAELFNSGASNYLGQFLTRSKSLGEPDVFAQLVVPKSFYNTTYGQQVPGPYAERLSLLVNKPLFAKLVTAGTLTGGNVANSITLSVLYGILDVTTGRFI